MLLPLLQPQHTPVDNRPHNNVQPNRRSQNSIVVDKAVHDTVAVAHCGTLQDCDCRRLYGEHATLVKINISTPKNLIMLASAQPATACQDSSAMRDHSSGKNAVLRCQNCIFISIGFRHPNMKTGIHSLHKGRTSRPIRPSPPPRTASHPVPTALCRAHRHRRR